jgi:hypothetical protein
MENVRRPGNSMTKSAVGLRTGGQHRTEEEYQRWVALILKPVNPGDASDGVAGGVVPFSTERRELVMLLRDDARGRVILSSNLLEDFKVSCDLCFDRGFSTGA